jgi:hypothetical protein
MDTLTDYVSGFLMESLMGMSWAEKMALWKVDLMVQTEVLVMAVQKLVMKAVW